MSLSKLSDTPVDLNLRRRPLSWTFSRTEPIPHAIGLGAATGRAGFATAEVQPQ